jgi:hypothetical protein
MGTRVLDDGSEQYQTRGGITVTRARRETSYADAIDSYIERLDERRGAVFSSNYEYPGRYTRWDVAIADPPIGITSFGRALWIEAYNARGEVLLDIITEHLKSVDDLTLGAKTTTRLDLTVNKPDRVFTEEERSKIPTVFSVLRAITDLFHSPEDAQIGLYGAFGYDLAFQFDAIELKLKRPDDQRDMVLFLPDEILVVDNYSAKAWIDRYDFEKAGKTTLGKAGEIAADPFHSTDAIPPRGDHRPGEYAQLVTKAKESFRRGDLFEVVPGQKFMERCDSKPGISGRGIAGNVRARQWTADRDLPDFRHDQARRRRDLGLRADPEASEFQKGRIRTDDVLGCRPQRQEPRLRTGFGQGHRPAADRDVFTPDPYGRPYRGPAARRHGCLRWLSQPCLGGDGHRGTQALGHAFHRGA